MKPSTESAPLQFHTVSDWSDEFWERIRPVYEASFPEHIRKPERIVRNMLSRMDAFLHEGMLDGVPCAMALSGLSADRRLLVVDYLGVAPAFRRRGAGRQMVMALADWARETPGAEGLLIESEADDSEEGLGRERFWTGCGFESTDYVHSYIWVPEKYRAMLLPLGGPGEQRSDLPRSGEKLFEYIEMFHKASFAR
ncbi:GNAT family N-acetyltransferase [Saccharibacillus sp. CPCC 101409]|uniref:GNAT family N-acetyltransferase n=1 Tax=Saccharibacillus sp. CPCC 101409 TaxID=3058041 RepID=UPI002672C350|nr:GNAT family N-acetyltransferase [Saccharibacillus sp. CPCC 101409]MDO3411749.1 GNAT family N-acetyltransferase [Saccharibacillus sp. CPCC 101409]